VELEEEQDGYGYYCVEDQGEGEYNDRDDIACAGGVELVDDCGDCEEEGEEVGEGEEDGVEEHEEEELSILETDAGVDPGAEWRQLYQWWSMLSTHRLQEEQWWVRYGL
jgi:hypothetical protein